MTLIVSDLSHDQDGPPAIWTGKLDDGREVNFRYRWGSWSIYTGEASIFSKAPSELLGSGESGRDDGICTWADFTTWAAKEGITLAVVGEIQPIQPW